MIVNLPPESIAVLVDGAVNLALECGEGSAIPRRCNEAIALLEDQGAIPKPCPNCRRRDPVANESTKLCLECFEGLDKLTRNC